ncbi:helix-turn-helix transcriptional regulator [Agromyces mediolanus]|uniref:helix-turn-helix domain-containing protein n=1 Tax=Agromyces mediolanus TaxID=41986 RepID=UPI0038391E89
MGELVDLQPVRRRPKPLWRDAVGEVLRGERLDQDRILTEVAGSAGVSPQYLSEIERGRKEASSEVLGAVTEALGLELHELVRRVGTALESRHEVERREAERQERIELVGSRRPAPLPVPLPAPRQAPLHGSGAAAPRGAAYLLAA